MSSPADADAAADPDADPDAADPDADAADVRGPESAAPGPWWRRPRVLAAAAVVVVVAVAGGVTVAVVTRDSGPAPILAPAGSDRLDVAQQITPAEPRGALTVQAPPSPVPNPTDIDGVLAWDTGANTGHAPDAPGVLVHDHVDGPVTYAVIPPVGGPHNAVWMNAGVYTVPIPAERAVHNLEHGAVWITYRPDLDAADVTALQSFVTRQTLLREKDETDQANRYVDLSPWTDDALPAPIVISAWGYQLRVDSPSDPRLQQFVDTFRSQSPYSPELLEPVDGIPVRTGGRPAMDGSLQPNPTGRATP